MNPPKEEPQEDTPEDDFMHPHYGLREVWSPEADEWAARMEVE